MCAFYEILFVVVCVLLLFAFFRTSGKLTYKKPDKLRNPFIGCRLILIRHLYNNRLKSKKKYPVFVNSNAVISTDENEADIYIKPSAYCEKHIGINIRLNKKLSSGNDKLIIFSDSDGSAAVREGENYVFRTDGYNSYEISLAKGLVLWERFKYFLRMLKSIFIDSLFSNFKEIPLCAFLSVIISLNSGLLFSVYSIQNKYISDGHFYKIAAVSFLLLLAAILFRGDLPTAGICAMLISIGVPALSLYYFEWESDLATTSYEIIWMFPAAMAAAFILSLIYQEEHYNKFILISIFALTAVLFIIGFLFGGTETENSSAKIYIGAISLCEVIKVLYICFLACIYRDRKLNEGGKLIIVSAFLLFCSGAFIILIKETGTPVLLFLITVVSNAIYLKKIKYKLLSLFSYLSLAYIGAVLLYKLSGIIQRGKLSTIFDRIDTCIHPELHTDSATLEYKTNIMLGGLFGNQQYRPGITGAKNDGILPFIAARFGIIITILIIVLFVFLLIRSIIKKGDSLSKLVMLIIPLQMIFQFLGNLNLIPLSGVGVPFISSGNNLSFVTFLMIGACMTQNLRGNEFFFTGRADKKAGKFRTAAKWISVFITCAVVITLIGVLILNIFYVAAGYSATEAEKEHLEEQKSIYVLKHRDEGNIIDCSGNYILTNGRYTDEYAYSVLGMKVNSVRYRYQSFLYDVNNSQTDPQKRNTLKLTLDSDLQRTCNKLLSASDLFSEDDNKKSSVLVLDKSGAIKAMVSYSGVDFSADKALEDVDLYNKYMGFDGSFLNHCVYGGEAPGSIGKILTTICALEQGNGDFTYNDTGSVQISSDYTVTNYNNGAFGELDIKRAFRHSSNVYYSQLGLKNGKEAMKNVFSRFLFNREIPLDFCTISSSVDFGNSDALLAMNSFGQGNMAISPLGICMIGEVVVNDGVIRKPYLIDSKIDSDGKEVFRTVPECLYYDKDTDSVVSSTADVQTVSTDVIGKLRDIMNYNVEAQYEKLKNLGVLWAKSGTNEIKFQNGETGNHIYLLAMNCDYTVLISINRTNRNGGELQSLMAQIFSAVNLSSGKTSGQD